MSPALADGVSQQQPQDDENENDDDASSTVAFATPVSEPSVSAPNVVDKSSDTSSASSFVPFKEEKKKGKSSKRRTKQSARKEAEDALNQRLGALVEELQDVLDPKEQKATLPEILQVIQKLLDLQEDSSSSNTAGTSNLRQLSAGAAQHDYRLAWVGSDDAICHVGTGLHKVPLARLQEIFLSLPGRNRVVLQEVIRVLGPFPNVKNTLQGQSTSTTLQSSNNKGQTVVDWTISWDSMTDGTGKELLSGTDENVRVVPLQVYLSTPAVVIGIVPPDLENPTSVYRDDPLQDNGKHVLVFVREDNLEDKLEILRVA